MGRKGREMRSFKFKYTNDILFIHQYINITIKTPIKNNCPIGYQLGRQAKLNRRKPEKHSLWQMNNAVHISHPEHWEHPPPDK